MVAEQQSDIPRASVGERHRQYFTIMLENFGLHQRGGYKGTRLTVRSVMGDGGSYTWRAQHRSDGGGLRTSKFRMGCLAASFRAASISRVTSGELWALCFPA
jgi:hypothetical protein